MGLDLGREFSQKRLKKFLTNETSYDIVIKLSPRKGKGAGVYLEN